MTKFAIGDIVLVQPKSRVVAGVKVQLAPFTAQLWASDDDGFWLAKVASGDVIWVDERLDELTVVKGNVKCDDCGWHGDRWDCIWSVARGSICPECQGDKIVPRRGER